MSSRKKITIAIVITAVIAAAVISLSVFLFRLGQVKNLSEPSRVFTDPATGKTVIELNVVSNREFHRDFIKKYPEILRKKYASVYKADPAKYGRFDWQNVELRLKFFQGFSKTIVDSGKSEPELWLAGNRLGKVFALIKGGKLKERKVDGPSWRIHYKSAPDVIWSTHLQTADYIESALFYPLDKYINDMPPEEREKLFRQLLPSKIRTLVYCSRSGSEPEHYWALPCGIHYQMVAYDPKVFRRYNIPFPTADWTWEDMLDICRQLREHGAADPAFRRADRCEDLCAFIRAAGGKVVERDRTTGNVSWNIDSEAFRKALTFYFKLFEHRKDMSNGKYYPNGNERSALYIIHGTENDFLSGNISPNLSVVPLPFGPPDSNGVRHRGTGITSFTAGISSLIKNPVVRDAAWEYILFNSSRIIAGKPVQNQKRASEEQRKIVDSILKSSRMIEVFPRKEEALVDLLIAVYFSYSRDILDPEKDCGRISERIRHHVEKFTSHLNRRK